MCGILGGWFFNQGVLEIEKRLHLSCKLLTHRGPDAHDSFWYSQPSSTLLLSHTRLAILDLSDEGKQPMTSQNGRFVMVFNGEIYNYRELRETLEAKGHRFLTKTDTEVLLEAWAEWGEAILPKLIGMFAFLILDKKNNTVVGARDAFGIKPFFYSVTKDAFVFASELPALLSLSGNKPKLNDQQAYDYLVYGDYDHSARTFIEEVWHLMPGELIRFDGDSFKLLSLEKWWVPAVKEQTGWRFSDAVEAVRSQFLENVKLHLRSDVPLGAALSGGLDSSAIVCAMRYLEKDYPIHTFSYVARGMSVSEEKWVDLVNHHVNAIPHKIMLSEAELLHDIDDLIRVQGEPFGSTSILAQYRLFSCAKKAGMTVTLDGQGADELLAGYQGYPGQRLRSLIECGEMIRAFQFAKAWCTFPNRRYRQAWMHWGSFYLPNALYFRLGRFTRKLEAPTWLHRSYFQERNVVMLPTRAAMLKENKGRRVMETLSQSLTGNGLMSLLRHADRNSMGFSIESRVPFLTIPFASLLLSLPEHYLISDGGETKHVFREAMRGIVPEDILRRRDKIGFATPEETWLKALSPFLRTWLLESRDIPFFKAQALLTQFDAMMHGKVPFSWLAWRFVNFVRWYRGLFLV